MSEHNSSTNTLTGSPVVQCHVLNIVVKPLLSIRSPWVRSPYIVVGLGYLDIGNILTKHGNCVLEELEMYDHIGIYYSNIFAETEVSEAVVDISSFGMMRRVFNPSRIFDMSLNFFQEFS